ncbi:hypothetical protein [Candidatus Uabimicrobium amorphum]|uniref:Uncharacterized protein n=1 Tax=Uabimicrobium amorphum TaxID=2596890 RepID=A0A5S9IS78_UABAM|nr:hypothetical protein [Candidatus Uabimicrobium amorphum]BBM86954.1 hypothetical protein UABAM_05356 [Candidatus Uabimicrobium amorphum]
MKKLCIAIVVVSLSFTLAEEQKTSIFDKLVTLKDKVKTYFEDAPRLSFRQKLKIGALLKEHRNEIRAMVDELRPHVIKVRRECRNVLTHAQLIKAMEMKDELVLRPGGEKIAMVLQKLDKEDRLQLLKLMQKVWRGETQNIGQNLETLHVFMMESIMPYHVRNLELTVAQQQQIKDILAKEKQNIRPLVVSLLTKAHEIRDKVKSKLSLAQINFFETNREKVVKEVLEFVEGL